MPTTVPVSVSAPIPAASTLRPELPPELDAALARGLAKEPGDRYGSAAELVEALRAALDEAAGATRIAPVPVPVPAERRRRSGRLLPLVALLLLAAGVLAATLLARAGDDPARQTQPQASPKTVRETVVQTVTTPAPTTQAAPTTQETPTTQAAPTTQEAPPPAPASAAEVNDQGFALMQAGDYEAALPLLEQAVQLSAGSGELVEAYASYNLAFTRFSLGTCDGVLDLLQRSEDVQGKRGEIKRLQREAEKACGGD